MDEIVTCKREGGGGPLARLVLAGGFFYQKHICGPTRGILGFCAYRCVVVANGQ